MRRIFISYCREDSDFSQVLEDRIRVEFPTWRDVNIGAGANWSSAIDDEIKSALAVIVIVSSRSQDSPYVNYEWALALGSGVEVLPVLLERPTHLHPRLSPMHALDFSNQSDRPWAGLLASLRTIADRCRPYSVRVSRDAPPVVTEAARALDSMKKDVRQAAIESLAEMRHSTADNVLADAMTHPIKGVRFAAAIHLGNRRDCRALPTLIEARIKTLGNDRWKAEEAIKRIGTPAIPALTQLVNDENEFGFAVSLLREIGGTAPIPILVEHLRNPRTRKEAVRALANTCDDAALPALRDLIHDPDKDLRNAVAKALNGFAGAIPLLIELAHDPDHEVRWTALSTLRDCGDCTAVPVLMEAVGQAGWIAMGLQRIGDPRAIPALIEALSHERDLVGSALESFGKEALPGLRAALHAENHRVRAGAAELLGRLGDETDIPRLLNALGDSNPVVRASALKGLHGKRSVEEHVELAKEYPEIVQASIERLQDSDEDVCIEAARALGSFRDPKAIPHLAECLQDDGIAESAESALEKINTREARAALRAWKKQKEH